MVGKKGVSPLIAIVLLIVFTVAISTLIVAWMYDYTKKTTDAASSGTTGRQGVVSCAGQIIDISNVYIGGGAIIDNNLTNGATTQDTTYSFFGFRNDSYSIGINTSATLSSTTMSLTGIENTGWGKYIRITNNGGASGFSSVAVDSADNIHVAWVDDRDGNNEIYYKKLDNSGSNLTGNIRLTNDASTSHESTVAVDSADNIHIVWHDDRDGNKEIYYKKLDNSGSNLTADIRITSATDNSWGLAVAVDSADNIHVAWVDERDGGTGEIYYKKLNNSGDNITADIRLTNDANWPVDTSIAVDSSDNLHIAWEDYRDGDNEIYYKKLDNDGINLTGDIRLTNDASSSWSPLVAVDSLDNIHIAWEDDRDGNYEMYYKKLNNTGGTLTGDTRLTNAAGQTSPSSIAIDSTDNIHIVCYDSRDGNSEVYYKRYGTFYPKNINLDVDSDGLPDWSYSETLTGTTTTGDLSSVLNSYGFSPAVLNFTSDTPGIIRISNINFLYSSSSGSTSALVSNTGLEDTTIKKIWASGSDGTICEFTPAYTAFEVGDFLTVSNTTCSITCDTFAAVRATTTCGSSAEFTGTPSGC